MKKSCLILAVIMILQTVIPLIAVNSEETGANAELIGDFTFETDSHNSPALISNGMTLNIGGEHGTVLSLVGTGEAASSYFHFDRTANSGVVSVSYDLYPTQKGKEAYVRRSVLF